jgi:hypothetical protein
LPAILGEEYGGYGESQRDCSEVLRVQNSVELPARYAAVLRATLFAGFAARFVR